MPFVSEPLSERHDTSQFDSGKPDLDRWLRGHALSAEARRTSRTFVWQADGRVVAHYTLAAHVLVREDLPRSLGRGNPAQIPAVLLGRLALDKTLHGQGLGGVLLAEALGRIVGATKTVAARFVVVDAVDAAAAAFYEHHGFRRIPQTARLVQKLGDIEAATTGSYGRMYGRDDCHQQHLHKMPNGHCGLGGTGLSCPVGVASTDT